MLHVRFEDPSVRRSLAPWVSEPGPSSDYGALRLRYGLDHHRERLSDAFAELAELYIAKREALHALWHPGPETVIHGDAHIGIEALRQPHLALADEGPARGVHAAAVEDLEKVFTNRTDHLEPMTGDDRTT